MKYLKLVFGTNAVMVAGMLAVHADKGAGPEAGVASVVILLLGWFLNFLAVTEE